MNDPNKNFRKIDKAIDTIQEGDFYMAGAFGACMKMKDRFGTKEWNEFVDYYRPISPENGSDLYSPPSFLVDESFAHCRTETPLTEPSAEVKFISVHPDEYARLINTDTKMRLAIHALKDIAFNGATATYAANVIDIIEKV